jgi:hypothetical protein
MLSIFSVHISNIREPSHAYFLSKSEALWLQSIGIGNCRLAMLETKYFTIIFTSCIVDKLLLIFTSTNHRYHFIIYN